MANVISQADELPAPPAPGLEDAMDDALAGLPAPPRVRVRVLGALLLAVSVAATFLAWQLRDDVRFAFSTETPIDLGDGRSVDVSHLAPNRMVHVHAAPEMAGAVRYSRPLFPGEHIVFPVAGRTGAPLFVQVDGSQVSPGEFTGRIVPFSGAGGRYARVGRFLASDLGENVNGGTYLIVGGVTPRSTMWAVLVVALLLALAVTDLLFFARLLRPAERD